MAARHQVTCLTFTPDAAAERALAPLTAICRLLVVHGPPPRQLSQRAWLTLSSPLPDMALRNAAPAYQAALSRLLKRESFDIVQAESIEMANYLGTIHRYLPEAHLVLDQFNAEFVLQRRAFLTDIRRPRRYVAACYSLIQWLKLARYERAVMRSCDAVLAVSDEDRRTLCRLAPETRIIVVPNGVDTTHFSRAELNGTPAPVALAEGQPALVFSGTLDFRPNIDAVTWFARQVLPRIRAHAAKARFLVVGKRPPPALYDLEQDGATTIVGPVADTRPYIAGATVYVVPMRIGGGVRLKLLEALALEAPVVSTRMGAEGVAGLHDDVHCLLADDPDSFAGAVLRLIGNPALGRQIGAAGRTLASAAYDWSAIIPRLEALYTTLSACSRPSQPG